LLYHKTNVEFRTSLEVDMATHIEPLLTVADLDIMPDDENRYEIIEGELLASRSPSITHQESLAIFFPASRPIL
jgi:hypothetical protein